MDKYEKQRDEILRTTGATLVRQRKHQVYRFADGRSIAFSSTPSDVHATRKMLADLKRILAHPFSRKAPTTSAIDTSEENQRKRVGQLPNPAYQDGDVIIPSLGPIEVKSGGCHREFTSLDQMLCVADETPEFWALSECGRTRVLQKLSEPFLKTEIRYIVTACLPDESIQKLRAVTGEFQHRKVLRLLMAFFQTYEKTSLEGRPALFLRPSETDSPLLLATSVTGRYSDYEQNILTPLVESATGPSLGVWPLTQAIEKPWHKYAKPQSIAILCLNTRDAKRIGLRLNTADDWTDPSQTRSVVRKMLDKLADPEFSSAGGTLDTLTSEGGFSTLAETEKDDNQRTWAQLEDISEPFEEIMREMTERGLDEKDVLNGMLYCLAQSNARIVKSTFPAYLLQSPPDEQIARCAESMLGTLAYYMKATFKPRAFSGTGGKDRNAAPDPELVAEIRQQVGPIKRNGTR
jgi:hypothetical protein